MPLLVDAATLVARRAVAAGELSSLATSLAAELDPLIDRAPTIPERKALLSREGGRCRSCGNYLAFDPHATHEYRCRDCGIVHSGELHDLFRLYWYQMWLAERAVHASLLRALLGREDHERLATSILEGYAERYLRYPNSDNVLGPSRVFFSTYLESIWLLQICVALDLLEMSGAITEATASRVRDRIIEPAVALIAGYDEGLSNRQVWNTAALMAGSTLLGRTGEAERRFTGSGGVRTTIHLALLPDGSWYEGENYHLFAHRGLWYGVTLAESAGLMLEPSLAARFHEGFATPFLTALPDFTYPARRDSPHGVSLRQWRYAEHCELGLARTDDRRLLGALARIYADDLDGGDTGRWSSSAEVERNMPAVRLDRSSLGWKTLLFARPTLPPLVERSLGSVLLESQGLAVFRRDSDRLYAALDYGHPGGGHGHPDRLNVLLANGSSRILDDMGTGSYVDPSLFWYRSTLSHNAPLVDGRSQGYAAGELIAYDERGSAGWIVGACDGIAPGIRFERTLVVMPDYVIDRLSWTADREVTVDLPVHVEGGPSLSGWTPAKLDNDASEFVAGTRRTDVDADTPVTLQAAPSAGYCSAIVSADQRLQWWIADGPGAPGGGQREFQLLRCKGTAATVTTVWLMAPAEVQLSHTGVTWSRGDDRHLHRRLDDRWAIELNAGSARSSIDLGGLVRKLSVDAAGWQDPAEHARPDVARPAPSLELVRGSTIRLELGESHYRRSELTWNEARRPGADVTFHWSGEEVTIALDVRTPHVAFVPRGAENIYDNEPADINGDGVQLYLGAGSASSAWILVPEGGGSAVRIRPIAGSATLVPEARWQPTARGYRIEINIGVGLPGGPQALPIDIIINLTAEGRKRRSGQLVLTGGEGEFVYLRGDRHDPHRRVQLLLIP